MDSFYSLGFAADFNLWKDHFAPTGELKKWLLADKKVTETDEWAKDPQVRSKSPSLIWRIDCVLCFKQEYKLQTDHIKKNGVAGALNWYKSFVDKVQMKDDAGTKSRCDCDSHVNHSHIVTELPKENYVLTKPVFFGAAAKDVICVAALGKQVHAQLCPNTTVVDFETGHWVQNALPDKVNEELLKWIKSIGA